MDTHVSDADAQPLLRSHMRRRGNRWKASPLLIVTVVFAVLGATVLAYSPAATWLAAYNQSMIVDDYREGLDTVDPAPAEQIEQAHRYNEALATGAVLKKNANIPTSSVATPGDFDYFSLLRTDTGVMSRIQIPSIDVDLPVYHGTGESTLLRGAGHLEGTSLPVGGPSTHSVITAHRGLADAVMFSNLDQLTVGDLFTITTLGEVMTYRVVDTRVVEPSDSETIRQEDGRDLVTLVTCTPLGINTHRILVTGERETPTPPDAQAAADGGARGVEFPWWLVLYLGALVMIAAYAGWAGRSRRGAGYPPPVAEVLPA